MPQFAYRLSFIVNRCFKYKIYYTRPKGFTLIELMVTVAVIAILSAIGFTTYSQSQVIARDGKRKQDLRSISQALEIYKQRNGHYPCTNGLSIGGWQVSSNTPGTNWITDVAAGGTGCGISSANASLDSNYVNTMPSDPTSNGSIPINDNNYGYGYYGAACGSFLPGGFYYLVTLLENKSDKDRNEIQDYKACNGSGLYSANSWSRYSFVITSQ